MPYIDTNNRTLVPLRVFSDVLDGEIKWNNTTKIVTLKSPELTVIATLLLTRRRLLLTGKM
ncbi:stalk domain-containing protein [Paenibacillus harenae]|uniref:stalk domain-containing protein n=1 Tax=Paenibacillus harenae TaxID=306543 RepID=UPI000A065A49